MNRGIGSATDGDNPDQKAKHLPNMRLAIPCSKVADLCFERSAFLLVTVRLLGLRHLYDALGKARLDTIVALEDAVKVVVCLAATVVGTGGELA